MPLWFASLDLRKAFDRIEWTSLFEALEEQHVAPEYRHLIATLYHNQKGHLADGGTFPIQRGVRQGDVLSTLLFNAASEMVMRRWKLKLRSHGLKLEADPLAERLTNVRFADDLIIYANSMEELVQMLDLLVGEFKLAGLTLNAKKSKIFTLDEAAVDSDSPLLVEVADGFVEVVRKGASHVYLGMVFLGTLRRRGRGGLAGRLQCSWAKSHQFKPGLTNRHVSLKLRLKLFNSVIVPCILYGLAVAPLNQADFEKLDVTQRKMLRQIIGFTKWSGETWQEANSRMKQKMRKATEACGISSWSQELLTRKGRLRKRVSESSQSPLLKRVFAWDPAKCADEKLAARPHRKRGRPRATWQQYLTEDA